MPNEEISNDEHIFRISVLTTLAELRVSSKGINDQLDRLNGSVAKQEARIATLEVKDAARAAAAEALTSARSKWEPWVRSISLFVIGAVSVLVLTHGPEIVKALFH